VCASWTSPVLGATWRYARLPSGSPEGSPRAAFLPRAGTRAVEERRANDELTLTELVLESGFDVTGADAKIRPTTLRLFSN
jgi:hypothetical protein